MRTDDLDATLTALIELHEEGHGDAASTLLGDAGNVSEGRSPAHSRSRRVVTLYEAGKTGEFKDKAGRRYCLDQGKRAKCAPAAKTP